MLSYSHYQKQWQSRGTQFPSVAEILADVLADLPKEDLRFLERYGPLRELEVASRREYCDWEVLPRIRKDPINFQLPDMQGLRELGIFLAVKRHYERVSSVLAIRKQRSW